MDDEPYIGRIVRMQFERGPFRVGVAYDGPGALAYLNEHGDVTCLLVDLHMPGMSGLDLLELLRQDPATRDLLAIVITAAGEPSQVERAELLGAAAVVTKPFSPRKLYRQVAELVGLPDAEPGVD